MTVILGRTAAGTQRMTERTRKLLTLKNFHLAGLAVLAVVCLYLMGQMLYAWQAARSQDASAIAQQTAAMRSAELAARPLAGLDEKLKQATVDADDFYAQRLPYVRSEVLAEMGALSKKGNVKLTRVGYVEMPVLEGTAGALTEVRMDASLTGDYRPLVLFINGLERDKMFFLIRGVALTGQQSGAVGVRLRITTFLRTPNGAEASERPMQAGTTVDLLSAQGGVQ